MNFANFNILNAKTPIKSALKAPLFALFIGIFATFLLSGCGTKREYYEPPKKLDGKLSYKSKLDSSIVSVGLDYARLKNKEVLGKNGKIAHFKLEKDYELLLFEGSEFVVANKDGTLKVLDENAEELFSQDFDAAVVAAAMSGDDLALVLADNTIILLNRSLGVRFSQTMSQAPAQDSRVAKPYFMDTLVIFPTLDGKLVVLDRASLKIVRDVVVSSEEFFNNVIYLKVSGELMIAATSSKIVIVTPSKTHTLNDEFRSVITTNNAVFAFTKNGTIIKTDFQLKKLAQRKFKYAIFNEAAVFKGALYVFEKTGYLLKMNTELKGVKVYGLGAAEDEKAFMGEGVFYYDNKILPLP